MQRRFETREKLGSGTYGDVYKCVEIATGDVYVLKKLKSTTQITQLMREISIMQRLSRAHPNIVSLVAVEASNPSSPEIVMEKLPMNMLQFLQCFRDLGFVPMFYIKLITRDILRACAFLHSRSVAHRDLKPENVLIDFVDKVTGEAIVSPHMNPDEVHKVVHSLHAELFQLNKTVAKLKRKAEHLEATIKAKREKVRAERRAKGLPEEEEEKEKVKDADEGDCGGGPTSPACVVVVDPTSAASSSANGHQQHMIMTKGAPVVTNDGRSGSASISYTSAISMPSGSSAVPSHYPPSQQQQQQHPNVNDHQHAHSNGGAPEAPKRPAISIVSRGADNNSNGGGGGQANGMPANIGQALHQQPNGGGGEGGGDGAEDEYSSPVNVICKPKNPRPSDRKEGGGGGGDILPSNNSHSAAGAASATSFRRVSSTMPPPAGGASITEAAMPTMRSTISEEGDGHNPANSNGNNGSKTTTNNGNSPPLSHNHYQQQQYLYQLQCGGCDASTEASQMSLMSFGFSASPTPTTAHLRRLSQSSGFGGGRLSPQQQQQLMSPLLMSPQQQQGGGGGGVMYYHHAHQFFSPPPPPPPPEPKSNPAAKEKLRDYERLHTTMAGYQQLKAHHAQLGSNYQQLCGAVQDLQRGVNVFAIQQLQQRYGQSSSNGNGGAPSKAVVPPESIPPLDAKTQQFYLQQLDKQLAQVRAEAAEVEGKMAKTKEALNEMFANPATSWASNPSLEAFEEMAEELKYQLFVAQRELDKKLSGVGEEGLPIHPIARLCDFGMCRMMLPNDQTAAATTTFNSGIYQPPLPPQLPIGGGGGFTLGAYSLANNNNNACANRRGSSNAFGGPMVLPTMLGGHQHHDPLTLQGASHQQLLLSSPPAAPHTHAETFDEGLAVVASATDTNQDGAAHPHAAAAAQRTASSQATTTTSNSNGNQTTFKRVYSRNTTHCSSISPLMGCVVAASSSTCSQNNNNTNANQHNNHHHAQRHLNFDGTASSSACPSVAARTASTSHDGGSAASRIASHNSQHHGNTHSSQARQSTTGSPQPAVEEDTPAQQNAAPAAVGSNATATSPSPMLQAAALMVSADGSASQSHSISADRAAASTTMSPAGLASMMLLRGAGAGADPAAAKGPASTGGGGWSSSTTGNGSPLDAAGNNGAGLPVVVGRLDSNASTISSNVPMPLPNFGLPINQHNNGGNSSSSANNVLATNTQLKSNSTQTTAAINASNGSMPTAAYHVNGGGAAPMPLPPFGSTSAAAASLTAPPPSSQQPQQHQQPHHQQQPMLIPMPPLPALPPLPLPTTVAAVPSHIPHDHAYGPRLPTPRVMTVSYRAPEVLLDKSLYNQSIDVWSVGCMIPELVTLNILIEYTPPNPRGNDDVYGDILWSNIINMFKVVGSPRSVEEWTAITDPSTVNNYAANFPKFKSKLKDVSGGKMAKEVGEDGMDLLSKMLVLVPEERITAQQALDHPWLQDVQSWALHKGLDYSVMPMPRYVAPTPQSQPQQQQVQHPSHPQQHAAVHLQ